eukprot:3507606-Rhodomonas_salina.3
MGVTGPVFNFAAACAIEDGAGRPQLRREIKAQTAACPVQSAPATQLNVFDLAVTCTGSDSVCVCTRAGPGLVAALTGVVATGRRLCVPGQRRHGAGDSWLGPSHDRSAQSLQAPQPRYPLPHFGTAMSAARYRIRGTDLARSEVLIWRGLGY